VPDASLAVDVDSGEALLFVPRKSRSELIFDGGVDDFEVIKEQTGVNFVFYDDEAVRELQARYALARIHTMDEEALVAEFPLLAQYTIDDSRLASYSFTARQEKNPTEIALLRVSTLVTSKAHEAIMRTMVPGTTEYETEARFLYECNTCGLRFQSYIPIVGAGNNGAVLHYVRNDAPVRDGDLVLVDAAGEYRGYTSDVTRTYPANGVYSGPQRAVYQTVLDAQQAAIALAGPGSVSFVTALRAGRAR
jgi:Xaa-Pro aminopeptidase